MTTLKLLLWTNYLPSFLLFIFINKQTSILNNKSQWKLIGKKIERYGAKKKEKIKNLKDHRRGKLFK